MPEQLSYLDSRINLAKDVYEPAEDSYLMIEAALSEIGKSSRALRILEIGTGSGIVSSVLMRKEPGHDYVTTDISPHAVLCAKSNGLQVIRADLFAGLRGRFDLIIFNPPYLPTAPDERIDGWLDCAWNGGDDGRRTIDRFLQQAPAFLADGGSLLLLISSLTGIDEVCAHSASAGFTVHEAASICCPGELLVVLHGRWQN
jgi:release factor glutamine methyltransferase